MKNTGLARLAAKRFSIRNKRHFSIMKSYIKRTFTIYYGNNSSRFLLPYPSQIISACTVVFPSTAAGVGFNDDK